MNLKKNTIKLEGYLKRKFHMSIALFNEELLCGKRQHITEHPQEKIYMTKKHF